MSKHRRQRNRRWQKTVSKANQAEVDYGVSVYERRGVITRAIPPLEKVLVVVQLKKLGFL